MRMEGLHEKEIFEEKLPFRLIVNQNINFNYPAHWHNAIELIYVLENDFTVFANSKEYHMNEKDILFIPMGDIHEFRANTPTGTRIFINFELSDLDRTWVVDRMRSQLANVRLITSQDEAVYTQIKGEIEKIMEERASAGHTSQLYYIARTLDILIHLCKSTLSQINIEQMANSKKISGLDKLNKSFEFIEKNYTEDIRLKEIASAAGFSEYYFSRLFKEVTEKSLHQYLNEYRIKKAEGLLNDPSYTISAAAYAVGFSSIATFDRVFRKLKGCSPMKFRRLRVGN